MFGIMKCFGGSNWGVIHTINDYELAVKIVRELDGMHNVVMMSELLLADSTSYINNKLGLSLTDDK
jgi:hypothetical protein